LFGFRCNVITGEGDIAKASWFLGFTVEHNARINDRSIFAESVPQICFPTLVGQTADKQLVLVHCKGI